MIIERGDECFGLLVDAVDNLITVAASDRRASPLLLDDGTHDHVREVIDVTAADGSDKRAQCVRSRDSVHPARTGAALSPAR
ncbi:hypothetical protein LP420_18175 [Massilia sp. B-10]|nr:hypothetical protein LP420_18175 [Massilia sp. B-10]